LVYRQDILFIWKQLSLVLSSPFVNDIRLTTQLALFLENRPGALARVCDELSKSKINILAVSTGDTVDYNVIRMVVSNPALALRLFQEHGSLAIESEVLLIEGDNKPGSLGAIARKLSEAGINIDYAYCATAQKSKTGLLVLRTSNSRKALKVLNT